MMKLSGFIFLMMLVVIGYMFLQGQQPWDQTLMEIQEQPEKGVDIRACQQDSDCIPIAEACCDCNQGGTRIAINRKYYKYSLDDKADSCMLAVCKDAVSTNLSCTTAKPTCVKGQCQMK